MAYIAWSEDLNTNIPTIDQQHRKLVNYVNELDEAISSNNREMVKHVLEELIDYTVFHFQTEEQLMQDIQYKYFIPHRMTHNIFVRRVGQYKNRFDDGEDIAQELYDVLVHWLLQHIKHEDQGYAADIRRKKEAQADRQSSHDHSVLTRIKQLLHMD